MWTQTLRGGCSTLATLVTLGLCAARPAAAQAPVPDVPPPESSEPGDPSPPIEPLDPPPDPLAEPPLDPATAGTPQDPTYRPPPEPLDPRQTDTTVVIPPPQVVDADDAYEEPYLGRMGIAVSAGGGVAGFTEDELRGATDDGGIWGVRVTLGSRSLLAFEGSYVGSVQEIEALGLDTDALLLGNGVQGALRLNFATDSPVQPFIYGGAAWMRYELTNADSNTSDVANDDDVLEIPLGAGVALRSRGFVIDVRGEFRGATEEDLMPTLETGEGDDAAMHRYAVNANVGYEF